MCDIIMPTLQMLGVGEITSKAFSVWHYPHIFLKWYLFFHSFSYKIRIIFPKEKNSQIHLFIYL